jgi:hypothetical protein
MDKLFPIITTTVHDPPGLLFPMVEKYLPRIIEKFGSIIVICSPATNNRLKSRLEMLDCIIDVPKDPLNYPAYSLSLRRGMEKTKPGEYVLYVDFDRLLHWEMSYPDELHRILTTKYLEPFVSFERSSRAFATHPVTQRSTEILVNELGSKIIGSTRIIDIIGATWLIESSLIAKILAVPLSTITGFYSVWPLLGWYWSGKKLRTEIVEGLEWETPDRYTDQIREIGMEKWLRQFQNSDEWQRRVELLADCLKDTEAFLRCEFAPN